MLIVTLVAIAQNQKQLLSPSTGEWINRGTFIPTMEHHLKIQRKKLSIQATTQMDPIGRLLSEDKKRPKFKDT